jgi:hypothetical protein
MKLAIMQPYFFPYLGYFDLLNQVDRWIAFDTVQYISRGWMNRNRILNHNIGWQYIIVPVKKHHRETPTYQIELSDQDIWERKIINQLQCFKGMAPYYTEVVGFLEDCFSITEQNLAQFNVSILRKTCKRIGIQTPIQLCSELGVLRAETPAEEYIINICLALGASEYINPLGGASLYSPERFAESGIKLTIQSFTPITYPCGRFEFIPNLSIIDVMMWNSPEEIKRYLDRRLT